MSFSHCRGGQHGADTLCVRIAGTYGLDQILNGSTSDNNVAVGHMSSSTAWEYQERDTMKTSEFPDIVRLKNNNVHKQNVDLHFHRLNQQ